MTELPITGVASRSERFPAGPWTAAAVAACGCAAVALIDPTQHMVTPPCPMNAITGWWCPFCGATRAASRLIRGDLMSALHFNAVFVVLLPLAALLWAAAAFPGRVGWLESLRVNTGRILTVVAVIFGIFMVIRNTPLGDTWLRYPGA